jgi:hypothetical protein
MDRTPYWLAIIGFSIINGLFSPAVGPAFFLMMAFSPAFFYLGLPGVAFFTSMLVSTGTLILSGIPAALYERFTGKTDSDAMSMWIWVACAALLAAPGLINMLSIAG